MRIGVSTCSLLRGNGTHLAVCELWKAQKDVLPALFALHTFALPVEYQGEVGTPPGQREQPLW